LVGVPLPVETLLGAMTPFLEGLALYAELDYEFEGQPEHWPPFPLAVRAAMTHMRAPMPPLKTFRAARELAIAFNGTHETPGHLELLFAPGRNGILPPPYYLIGYLYTKAAVALLARRCPPVALPAIALPLLNRLWTDHPAIDELLAGRINVSAFILALHKATSGVGSGVWRGVASMLKSDPLTGGAFDRWQLHEQMGSHRFDTPILRPAGPPAVVGVSERFRQLLAQLTAASDVHVLACTMGPLLPPNENGAYAVGEPENEIRLLPLEAFWKAWRSDDPSRSHERALIERYRFRALEMERKMTDKLRASVGKQITIADIVTLTGEYSCCVALWVDGDQDCVFVPYNMAMFESPSEFQTVRNGIAIPLKERLELSGSLSSSETQLQARNEATLLLTTYLISDARARDLLRQHRFSGLAGLSERSEIKEWLRPNPGRQADWVLEVSRDGVLASSFDLPGFPTEPNEQPIRFFDLLPQLPPFPH
jgi:hypothetical protein